MLDCDLDSVEKPLQMNWYIRVQFSSHLIMKLTTSSIILGNSLIVPRCASDPCRSSRILKAWPTREEHDEEGGGLQWHCSSRRQNTKLHLDFQPRSLVFNIFLSTPRRLHLSTRQGTKFHNFSCHYLQFWLWFPDRGYSRWLVPESVGKIRLSLSDEQMTSRCCDPVEVSGTFWNLSLVYKICNLLYILTGLQRNVLFQAKPMCNCISATMILRTLDAG